MVQAVQSLMMRSWGCQPPRLSRPVRRGSPIHFSSLLLPQVECVLRSPLGSFEIPAQGGERAPRGLLAAKDRNCPPYPCESFAPRCLQPSHSLRNAIRRKDVTIVREAETPPLHPFYGGSIAWQAACPRQAALVPRQAARGPDTRRR